MSIQIERIPLSAQLGDGERALITDMLAAHGRVTLVVPNFGARDACRRALADAGCGVGVDVTTPDGWIQAWWELLGDGRRVVTATQRRLLMARALAEYLDGADAAAGADAAEAADSAEPSHAAGPAGAARGLANTPGTIKMLAQAARRYLPFIEERADAAALTPSERQIAGALRRYANLARGLGLVEASEVAVELARALRAAAPACARGVVLRGVHDMPEYLLELVGAVASEGEVRLLLEQEAASEEAALLQRFGMPAPDGAGQAVGAGAMTGGAGRAGDADAITEDVPQGDGGRDRGTVPPVPVRCVEVCGPAACDAAYTRLLAAAASSIQGRAGEAAVDGMPAAAEGPVAATGPTLQDGGAPSDGGRRDAAPGGQGSPCSAVAAASPDPLATFRALGPRLAAQGLASAVEARVPFRATRAGQTIAMLSDFLERIEGEEASAWWPAPEVPDWIRSPFSGLSTGAPRVARMLDTRLRKTRSLTKDALFSELESLQSRETNRERALAERAGRPRRPIAVKAVLDALGAHRYARALQLMAECAAAAPLAAFGAEGLAAKQAERAALEAARAFMEEARGLGVTEEQAFLVLPELSVRVSMQMAPRAACRDAGEAAATAGTPAAGDDSAEGDVPAAGIDVPAPGAPAAGDAPVAQAAPAVAFLPLDALSSSAPARYGASFLLDVDAASFPLAERDTPLTLLAEKLFCAGIAAKPAERQRIAFRGACEAAQVAVLAYVARDRQAEERYPALSYAEAKEALDAARASSSLDGGGVGSTSTPSGDPAARTLAALDRAIARLPHEGALFANLDPADGAGAERALVTACAEHALPPELNGYLLLPERSLGSRAVPRTLSASQIENYLACPYRWLVSNRASTRRLDVEFGPIEMGNFVHDVMQRFHERLIDAGLMRVRPETVEACLGQMDEAFEEIRADHARGKYTHGKYAREERPRAVRGALVPLDELERNRLDAMLPKLHEVVRYEADMLSIFTPAQFEYSFDKEGVRYAGRPLGGRIDRIDTAPDAGRGERFVVIDYKNRASVRELGCADPTMMLEEGERLGDAWLPGRDADRAPKVQTLIYAQALERAGGGSAQGAVYFATRGPQVAGAVADALVSSEPPAFPHDGVSGFPGVKPPRSRTAKHDGTLEFQQLLDAVEAGVARELDALEQGAVAPRPASDSCSFCPLTMCERRRS